MYISTTGWILSAIIRTLMQKKGVECGGKCGERGILNIKILHSPHLHQLKNPLRKRGFFNFKGKT